MGTYLRFNGDVNGAKIPLKHGASPSVHSFPHAAAELPIHGITRYARAIERVHDLLLIISQ